MNLFSLRKMVLLPLLVSLCACTGVSYKALNRVDLKVDGFIKHYDGSFFKIGNEGIFSVELITSGDRMKAGNSRFQLVLHHSLEGDMENAKVTIIATHKQSSATVRPKIWEDQYGLYDVIGATLSEPGEWTVVVSISKGALRDEVTFVLPGQENNDN